MLYKGNTKHYQHILADDQDHESDLKDQGYVDFADLEKWTGLASEVVGSASKGELPVDPKLDELSKKVVDLELQLNVAQTERDENIAEVERLNAIIERGSKENIELRKRIEEQASVAQTERDENIVEVERLNVIIERGSKENIELRKQLDEFTSQVGQAVDAKPKNPKPKVEQ